MGYCKRCGDLNTNAKCKKCGGPVMSRTLHHHHDPTGDNPVIDRWKSRYMNSINGSEQLNVDSSKGSLSIPTKNINYFDQIRRKANNSAIAPIPVSSFSTTRRSQSVVASTLSNTTGGICKKCEVKIVDRSFKLDTGATYHPDCLLCHHCNKVLTDNAFSMLDNKFYHNQCVPMDNHCKKCRQQFDNVYIYVNHAKYHVECFGCTSCNRTIPPSSMYMEMAKLAYCKPCAGSKFADDGSATMKVVPPPVSIMAQVILTDDVKPSALFSSRARPLPQFGGSKKCPACHQVVNILEEKNGPMASKWHKKCLKCEMCSKPLDSSAIMKDNGQFTSLVCRSCHYNRVDSNSQQKIGQIV
ncbi:hypothetical protein BGW37DRAFT_91725 [Umbelopsis sp. PMI_123]|nr:hypothetical protein BGW37DRAFT_91725 [Umbelopsis sp. PMI_123]